LAKPWIFIAKLAASAYPSSGSSYQKQEFLALSAFALHLAKVRRAIGVLQGYLQELPRVTD
jgi:hypothetical protein